ncbi:LuxR C-terminal-related transcriptional regulator [Spongiibacter taiwanensis]
MKNSLHSHEPPNFGFSVVSTRAYEQITESPLPPSKVSQIVAPTGYGKTVLLTALYNDAVSRGISTFWICLSDFDDTSERVLARFEYFMNPDVDSHFRTEDMHKSDEPVEQRLDRVIEFFSRIEGPVMLFIDNLDYCIDETLGALINHLVFGTGSQFFLMLASTKEPMVNFSRAMLAGLVARYGFEELGLNRDGARQLFGQSLADALGERGLERAVEVSEGWPAALRLMQIILAKSSAPEQMLEEFSGADADLAQMLSEQLIGSFDPEFSKFLFTISLVKSFTGPLCQVLCRGQNTDGFLQQLISNNLFIIPLSRRRDEYRLHSLFRGYLIDQARQRLGEPYCRQTLLAASSWFEERGRWVEAIDYALEAADNRIAVACLERVAANFVRDKGDLSKYINWVERILASGGEPGLETDYWYVWALVFHRRYDYAEKQLDRLSRRLESGTGSQLAGIRRRVDIIRITCATYTDHHEEARRQGLVWLEERGEDDPFDVATVACGVGISFAQEFDFLNARKNFAIAHSSIRQSSSDYGMAWVSVLSALVEIHEGDFGHAYNKSTEALKRVRQTSGDYAGIVSTLASWAALAAVETGRDAEAAEFVRLSMGRLQTHGVVDTVAHALNTAVKLWAGPLGDGISISKLRDIAEGFPQRLSVMLSCFIIQRLLRLGRLDGAIDEAKRIGLGSETARENRFPLTRFLLDQTQSDLEVVQGRLAQADARIARMVEHAKEQGRYGHLVELTLLQMTSALRSAHPENGAKYLVRAVTFAAKRRYFRPFRERSDLIAGLVNESKAKNWGFASAEEKEFFAELCKGLPIANSSVLEQIDGLDGEMKLLETPTPRELELLQLIDAGLSNQQLADRLFVSVATVKWHLYNLYSKLNVANRASAIAKARALNLISN